MMNRDDYKLTDAIETAMFNFANRTGGKIAYVLFEYTPKGGWKNDEDDKLNALYKKYHGYECGGGYGFGTRDLTGYMVIPKTTGARERIRAKARKLVPGVKTTFDMEAWDENNLKPIPPTMFLMRKRMTEQKWRLHIRSPKGGNEIIIPVGKERYNELRALNVVAVFNNKNLEKTLEKKFRNFR